MTGCPCNAPRPSGTGTIPAGLDEIPRRVGAFPDFRRALLAGVRSKPALGGWRARGEADLGMMLLELWAYACDALAFADETLAHEAYLRTARLRPSLRRLVALLGYVPRPAVASAAWVAAVAEGRRPVELPAGTAFRTTAFGSEPPQVFELDAPMTVHPLTNRWTVAPTRPTTLAEPPTNADVAVHQFLLEARGPRPDAGGLLLVRAGALGHARVSADVADVTGDDGRAYARVTVDYELTLPRSTPLASVSLSRPTQTATLWTLAVADLVQPGIEDITGATRLTLDNLHRQIKPGSTVLLARGDDVRWFGVASVTERQRAVSEPVKVGTPPIDLPAVKVPVSQLTLDAPLNAPARRRAGTPTWSAADAATIVVHHRLVPAGTVTAQARTRLDQDDEFSLMGVEPPEDPHEPARFLLEDRNGRGVAAGGAIDFDSGELTLDADVDWEPSLPLPVEVYGNVVRVSRGETVAGEVLGSGDASVPSQTFELRKGPLTYLTAPGSASGVASTLRVSVDGILWREVPSFFGAGPQDQIYVVRQDDDGGSVVTFGDGVRGARLPSGRDNVVGSYRFGAGAATPPAGSIVQLARPVPGLTAVRDPVGASGGADAEDRNALRRHAPRSALLLGRAVSIHDLEAAAARVPGVGAVRAEWRWNGERQRPVVQLWYVGDASLDVLVSQMLRAISDPTVPIDVDASQPVPAALALDLRVDPRRVPGDVTAAVRAELLDPERGLLAPDLIGIGQPLFRSRIFAAATAVPGVEAVRALRWNGADFPGFAVDPGAGRFFDLRDGLEVTAGG